MVWVFWLSTLASWAAARLFALPAVLTAALQRLTFDWLVPALLFHTMATVPLRTQFNSVNNIVQYACLRSLDRDSKSEQILYNDIYGGIKREFQKEGRILK